MPPSASVALSQPDQSEARSGHALTPGFADRQPLLLSIDFEDWHRLIRRRLGVDPSERPSPALRRQTQRLLALLDALGVRATFFVLGMAARSHPDLVEMLATRGHEIACHGDAHVLVHRQTRQEFTTDLRSARATIERVTGRRPTGYRAPAFSITRETPWAYEVLLDEGFTYDASQHDTPRVRDRIVPSIGSPHPLKLRGGVLWEFPVAVWHTRNWRVPVGGASYWALTPTALVLEGLRRAGPLAGLYLHPYELDPDPLRPGLPPSSSLGQRARAALRAGHRNLARHRAPGVLRAIAERHSLIPYGEAHAQLSGRPPTGP